MWDLEITLKGSSQAGFFAVLTETPQVLWLPEMVPGESYCYKGQVCLKIALFRSRNSFLVKDVQNHFPCQ